MEILSGHPEQAAPLNVRLETILQKPLEPWKEDFMETTSLYAGLLTKAGKTEAAGSRARPIVLGFFLSFKIITMKKAVGGGVRLFSLSGPGLHPSLKERSAHGKAL